MITISNKISTPTSKSVILGAINTNFKNVNSAIPVSHSQIKPVSDKITVSALKWYDNPTRLEFKLDKMTSGRDDEYKIELDELYVSSIIVHLYGKTFSFRVNKPRNYSNMNKDVKDALEELFTKTADNAVPVGDFDYVYDGLSWTSPSASFPATMPSNINDWVTEMKRVLGDLYSRPQAWSLAHINFEASLSSVPVFRQWAVEATEGEWGYTNTFPNVIHHVDTNVQIADIYEDSDNKFILILPNGQTFNIKAGPTQSFNFDYHGSVNYKAEYSVVSKGPWKSVGSNTFLGHQPKLYPPTHGVTLVDDTIKYSWDPKSIKVDIQVMPVSLQMKTPHTAPYDPLTTVHDFYIYRMSYRANRIENQPVYGYTKGPNWNVYDGPGGMVSVLTGHKTVVADKNVIASDYVYYLQPEEITFDAKVEEGSGAFPETSIVNAIPLIYPHTVKADHEWQIHFNWTELGAIKEDQVSVDTKAIVTKHPGFVNETKWTLAHYLHPLNLTIKTSAFKFNPDSFKGLKLSNVPLDQVESEINMLESVITRMNMYATTQLHLYLQRTAAWLDSQIADLEKDIDKLWDNLDKAIYLVVMRIKREVSSLKEWEMKLQNRYHVLITDNFGLNLSLQDMIILQITHLISIGQLNLFSVVQHFASSQSLTRLEMVESFVTTLSKKLYAYSPSWEIAMDGNFKIFEQLNMRMITNSFMEIEVNPSILIELKDDIMRVASLMVYVRPFLPLLSGGKISKDAIEKLSSAISSVDPSTILAQSKSTLNANNPSTTKMAGIDHALLQRHITKTTTMVKGAVTAPTHVASSLLFQIKDTANRMEAKHPQLHQMAENLTAVANAAKANIKDVKVHLEHAVRDKFFKAAASVIRDFSVVKWMDDLSKDNLVHVPGLPYDVFTEPVLTLDLDITGTLHPWSNVKDGASIVVMLAGRQFVFTANKTKVDVRVTAKNMNNEFVGGHHYDPMYARGNLIMALTDLSPALRAKLSSQLDGIHNANHHVTWWDVLKDLGEVLGAVALVAFPISAALEVGLLSIGTLSTGLLAVGTLVGGNAIYDIATTWKRLFLGRNIDDVYNSTKSDMATVLMTSIKSGVLGRVDFLKLDHKKTYGDGLIIYDTTPINSDTCGFQRPDAWDDFSRAMLDLAAVVSVSLISFGMGKIVYKAILFPLTFGFGIWMRKHRQHSIEGNVTSQVQTELDNLHVNKVEPQTKRIDDRTKVVDTTLAQVHTLVTAINKKPSAPISPETRLNDWYANIPEPK